LFPTEVRGERIWILGRSDLKINGVYWKRRLRFPVHYVEKGSKESSFSRNSEGSCTTEIFNDKSRDLLVKRKRRKSSAIFPLTIVIEAGVTRVKNKQRRPAIRKWGVSTADAYLV